MGILVDLTVLALVLVIVILVIVVILHLLRCWSWSHSSSLWCGFYFSDSVHRDRSLIRFALLLSSVSLSQ